MSLGYSRFRLGKGVGAVNFGKHPVCRRVLTSSIASTLTPSTQPPPLPDAQSDDDGPGPTLCFFLTSHLSAGSR